MLSETKSTMILLILFGTIPVNCRSRMASIKVEPLVFSHADEMVRNEDFIILADRRVFTVMAFMNACDYDKQFDGIPMHPVRIRVREAIRLKAEAYPDELAECKEYYRKKALPNFFYMDYALSLCDDYPFRRIRPDSELGYPATGRRLADFPDILNKFWETIGLEQIWAQVKPDYLAEISSYDLSLMARQLTFVWEYLRLERKDHFTFVSIPNLLDTHCHAIGARYEDYWYAVESPGAHSYDFNVHEYLHSIINTLVDKNYKPYQSKLDKYFKAGKNTTIAKSYGSPAVYASECLVRALDHRIAILMTDNPETVKHREALVKRKTQDGLLLTEPFYELLVDFEQSKLDFKEFLPKLMEKLSEYRD
jgi:hypothetical protein